MSSTAIKFDQGELRELVEALKTKIISKREDGGETDIDTLRKYIELYNKVNFELKDIDG